MTIGIAIPTFSGHLYHLKKLLTRISESSVLPTQVSVSISSFDGEISLDEYPFELIITKTTERKNPCENRNIAASKLTTDIISFIDGDDIPHIKRNEYIIESFNLGAQAVVHNYNQDSNSESEWFKSYLDPIHYLHEYVDTVFDYSAYSQNSTNHQDYHCAHISVKKEIFDNLRYDEHIGWIVGEDAEYTRRLVNNNIKISYIPNKISQYVK